MCVSLQPVGVQLVSIHSSPNDRQLWALDNRGSVHVRTGLNEEMPVGTDWEQVPGRNPRGLSPTSGYTCLHLDTPDTPVHLHLCY